MTNRAIAGGRAGATSPHQTHEGQVSAASGAPPVDNTARMMPPTTLPTLKNREAWDGGRTGEALAPPGSSQASGEDQQGRDEGVSSSDAGARPPPKGRR